MKAAARSVFLMNLSIVANTRSHECERCTQECVRHNTLVFRATQLSVGGIAARFPAPDLIAKHLMAVLTGIGHIAADVAHLLLISGLGCTVCCFSHVRHFFGESYP